MSNLIQSCTSGSKTVSVLNGKVTPSGSYTNVNEWLKEWGAKALECPEEDLDTYFDNIGRYIIQNYRVSTDKNTKSNIFATGVHIIADKVTNLQTRTELKPIFWKTFSDENEKHGEMGKVMTENDHVFRTLRYKFLSELLCLAMVEGNDHLILSPSP